MHRFNANESYGMMGRGFSGQYDFRNQTDLNFGIGPGMMDGWLRRTRYNDQDQPGIPYGMGPGMMGGRFGSGTYTGEPLTITQAKDAVDAYLD